MRGGRQAGMRSPSPATRGLGMRGEDTVVPAEVRRPSSTSKAGFDRALASPGYADSPVILANSGACAGKAGQQQRAERDLRRAIELDPENPVALAALAQREFGAGNAFGARAFSERRLAAAPADPKTLLLASQIEQKLGDSAAAARYVSRLKAEFPDAPEARNSTMGDGGRQ